MNKQSVSELLKVNFSLSKKGKKGAVEAVQCFFHYLFIFVAERVKRGAVFDFIHLIQVKCTFEHHPPNKRKKVEIDLSFEIMI